MNVKKIFGVIILSCLLVFGLDNIFAMTNENYGSGDFVSDITDEVVKESIVTEYISQFIFAIGNIFETVVSWIFGLLTGINSFPWADEIIFNTIGLLDVNFINPASDSIFSNTGVGIGDVVRNIYFTGLSIAVGFLGIIIGVMAIRMAISTIASEKAKYKESIIKWLTSLILLFGMHYGLSFLFYMNEQLVIVASDILDDTLDKVGEKLADVMNATTGEKKREKVVNTLNDCVQQAAEATVGKWVNPITAGIYAGSAIMGERTELRDVDDLADVLYDNYDVTYELVRNSTVRDIVLKGVDDRTVNHWWDHVGNFVDSAINIAGGLLNQDPAFDALWMLYEMNGVIKMPSSASQVEWLNGYNVEAAIESYDSYLDAKDNLKNYFSDDSDNYKLASVVLDYAYKYKNGSLGHVSGTDLIANLGQYFKDDTWASGDGWKTTSVSVTSAILYTIFVFQSIGFFISYIRRLFMVTVLSIIAPFVIIYDFFLKAAVGSRTSVFTSWFKELFTLIFVQTFQAFLLAIIMTMIISLTVSDYLRDENGISAVGILAIFALLSLSKIELLVKNIFGLTSGVADTSLAAGQKSSFAGGLLALHAGKKLLDNPRKMLGGAKNAVLGQFRMRQARNNKMDRDIPAKLKADGDATGELGASTGNSPRSGGSGTGAITRLSDNIAELTRELQKQSRNADTKDKGDKLKELQNAIDEAKKQRDEGLKSMLKGGLETVGAAHGALAGGVIGMARGENTLETAIQGAGVGDVIGEAVSNAITSTPSTAREVKTGIKAEIRAHVKSPYKDAYKQLEEELKKDNKKNMEELDKKIYEYVKQNNIGGKDVKVNKSSNSTPKARNINADAGNIQ